MNRVLQAVSVCVIATLAATFSFYLNLTKPEGYVSKDWCNHPAKPKCTLVAIQVKEALYAQQE